jgi:hypothetical protein
MIRPLRRLYLYLENSMIRIEKLFDASGKWLGNKDRSMLVAGKWTTVDEYAEEHGIELPEVKTSKKPAKQVNIDIEEKANADMGQSQHERSSKVD